jgi:hypothetical protein
MKGPRNQIEFKTPSGGKSCLAATWNGQSVDIDVSRSSDGELWFRLTPDQAEKFAHLILAAIADGKQIAKRQGGAA